MREECAQLHEEIRIKDARLAHFKVAKYAGFGPLPKTSTGKTRKFKLHEKEWARQEKRIR